MEERLKPSIDNKELSLTKEEASTLAKELQAKLQRGIKPEDSKEQITKLIAGLSDQRGLLRRTFSETLGIIGKKALPELRYALLNSKDVTVRRAAAKTLKLVGAPEALPDLLKALLRDKDPVVQGSSAGAMAIFGEEAVEYLVEVIENPKSTSIQCGLAKWGLAFIGAEGSKSLKQAAKSKNPLVRASAIAALGEQIQSSNDKDAKSLLQNALEDESDEVQIEAIRLMGVLEEYTWDLELLASKLKSSHPDVRKQAALSLMKINEKDQLKNLKSSLKIEKNNDVKLILKLAIKKLLE